MARLCSGERGIKSRIKKSGEWQERVRSRVLTLFFIDNKGASFRGHGGVYDWYLRSFGMIHAFSNSLFGNWSSDAKSVLMSAHRALENNGFPSFPYEYGAFLWAHVGPANFFIRALRASPKVYLAKMLSFRLSERVSMFRE